MSYQDQTEFEEFCIQTNENSMDLYDSIENYLNPQYFFNQEQLLEDLYRDSQEDSNQTRDDKKMHTQSLGNIDEIQQQQGKRQAFNFHQLEQYSEVAQQLKKKPLNIGQMYLQSLEKQASTLKKVDLKFGHKNNANNNIGNGHNMNNNDDDESNSIHANLGSLRKQIGRQQIKSQIIEIDLPENYDSQQKNACYTYFQEPRTNSYLRLYNKNDESLTRKFFTTQAYNQNTNPDQTSGKYKIKGYSQHSGNNINNPEEGNSTNKNNSPQKRQSLIQQKKIRAMTQNQQFRSSFRTIKQADPQLINNQFNTIKSIFSDFQQEVKQRDRNSQGSIVLLNMKNARSEQSNKAGGILNTLGNDQQYNQKQMSLSKIILNKNNQNIPEQANKAKDKYTLLNNLDNSKIHTNSSNIIIRILHPPLLNNQYK